MKNLNLFCPINGTGYGITSLNITKALSNTDINISLFPIGNNIECNNETEKPLIQKLLDNSNSFDYSAPCLKIWHQYDLSARIGNSHYYTFPFFEIDKLTNREIHQLNYCDFIFVASEWAKDILINNGVKQPISVCPLGVDATIFNIPPHKIKLEKPNYIFFHIGKWEHRKSQDILLQAFDAAFDINDNVELYLLPFNPFLNEQENQYWFNLVNNCKLKDKIKVFGRLQTQYQVAEFINNCDCGVFVSRAEGWNNEIIETMAMNKPVIVTDYSAHTQYCNKKNSYLVDIRETEPANDGKWFNGFGNWAKIGQNEFEQIVSHMKYVYNNRIDSNLEGVLTANQHSWNNTANIIHSTMLRNNSYYANTKTKTKRR
jgi:glycosyltransferase involved in cell wall biosynthesis